MRSCGRASMIFTALPSISILWCSCVALALAALSVHISFSTKVRAREREQGEKPEPGVTRYITILEGLL